MLIDVAKVLVEGASANSGSASRSPDSASREYAEAVRVCRGHGSV